jgi:hypothetical protein
VLGLVFSNSEASHKLIWDLVMHPQIRLCNFSIYATILGIDYTHVGSQLWNLLAIDTL